MQNPTDDASSTPAYLTPGVPPGGTYDPADWEALWDHENLWWAVGSRTHGCFDNSLTEQAARALAAALNAPSTPEAGSG